MARSFASRVLHNTHQNADDHLFYYGSKIDLVRIVRVHIWKIYEVCWVRRCRSFLRNLVLVELDS